MIRRLRPIAAPFVVAPPAGARIRARLRVSDADAAVLVALGTHLGSLAGADLARRCREGRLTAKERAESRKERKRTLTARSSSRWAGAITRSSEDGWQLGLRNLVAEAASLRSRIKAIERRVALPVGEGRGTSRGYATANERFGKQRRLQILRTRLADVHKRLDTGHVSICRGGGRLMQTRQNLEAAKTTEEVWRSKWEAQRLFITADGEADKNFGNETIRFNPEKKWLEMKLPAPQAHLANRPHGRYRISCPVEFSHRGDELAAQVQSGAVRYDIFFDPERGRWYLDASWKTANTDIAYLDELGDSRLLGIDLNHGHLAICVVDCAGNPVGKPATVPIQLAGLPASTRDGHLRAAISTCINAAKESGCRAIAIENLDFAEAREDGREHIGRRPNRGKRGKAFRRMISGIPTAKFADRIVQMAANAGLVVVAVDPAYTSKWGAEHWLGALKEISPEASGHHAAALTVARRGLGHSARRWERCDSTPPVDGEKRATDSAGSDGPPTREPVIREARGQPHLRRKTRRGEGRLARDQGGEDRSCRPEVAMSYSLLL